MRVEGDKAILKGVVADQWTIEKAVIAVGNTLGISKVEAEEIKIVAPDSGLSLEATDMTALVKASTPAKAPVSIRSRRATISGRSPRRTTARARAPSIR